MRQAERARRVRDIFEACRALTEATGRPISPDGHLVGSIGEVLAAEMFDLVLEVPSNAGYDALDSAGCKVEIKTTTRRSVSLSSADPVAERLVVVALDEHGAATVVYDGNYRVAWAAAGKPQRNGQRTIGFRTLQSLV